MTPNIRFPLYSSWTEASLTYETFHTTSKVSRSYLLSLMYILLFLIQSLVLQAFHWFYFCLCFIIIQGDVFIAIQSPVKTSRTVLGQCTAFGDKLANKMGPLTTPTKRRDVRSVDPWTPTSNLKMLISAASPDIRNREKELCLDHEGVESLDASQVQRPTPTAHIDTSRINGSSLMLY